MSKKILLFFFRNVFFCFQLNMTAESVLRQDVNSLMTEAGCPAPKDCFIYMYANDPAAGISNWVYLAELKDSSLQKAETTVSSFQQKHWGFEDWH